MFESFVGFVVLTAVATWALFPGRPRREPRGDVLPFPAAPPARGSTGIALLVAGPLLMIAGLLVIAWPDSSSDCHGSPVCGIDAIGKFIQLLFGGGLAIVGVILLVVGAFRGGERSAR